MKNTVMVPLVFFLNLLIWIAVLSFFSVFASYNGMTTLTAGSVPVFLYECLYRSVFYLPLATSIALITVFFFLMRHKTIYWITGLTILALLVLFVYLVLPLSYRYLDTTAWSFLTNRTVLNASSDKVFSPDILRPDGDTTRVVWYSVRNEGTTVDPLLVFRPGQTQPVINTYSGAVYDTASGGLKIGDTVVVSRAAGPDPLYTPLFTPPPVVAIAAASIDRVMNAFFGAFQQGFFPYMLFSSAFFLSVALLWLCCHASSWRLLNILFAISGLLYLYGAYAFFTGGPLFSLVRKIIPSSFSTDSIPALLYFLQSAILALVGAFVFLRRLVHHEGWRQPS